MKAGDGVVWTPATFEGLTGETVDALWADYLASACCQGKAQTCCK